MKKITLIFSAMLIVCVSYSQSLKPVAQKIFERNTQRATVKHAQLFEITSATVQRSAEMEAAVGKATVFEFQQNSVNEILASKPENLDVTIPTNSGSKLELELFKANIFTPDFSVVTSSSDGQAVPYEGGAHYWGIIKGDNASIVSISIFNDEIMGMISSPSTGNMVLGKIEHDATNRHILYNERDLKATPNNVCYTEDDGGTYTAKELQQNSSMRTTSNCIRIYWEVNLDVEQNKGSVTAATNYVTGLFSQSAIIYTNDAIPVLLSQVFVWNTASPYTSTSTSTLLSQFQNNRNSFNGDLGTLLGYAGGGGIAAGFSGLCASNLDNSQCYAGISSGYLSVPAYSWSVEVVTHEQGHLMGSRHTHACVWNGNNTAIDGCGPAAGYSYEGSCSGAPIPSNGGTIMSYCHLVSAGINFSLGFGTQPKNVILNNFNNATCLSSCSGGGCGTPGGLSSSAITVSSATVTWSMVGGALSYNVQYKKSALTTWATVTGITGTQTTISGLTDGTAYDYQVQAVCSSATGTFSTVGNFSTIAICNDTHEPNNTKATATSVVLNTNTAGLISPSGDVDFYYFNNTSSQKNINVTLTGLPADYDLKLMYKTSTVGTSQHGGVTSESIVYNTSVVGKYVAKVYGSGGANNPTACYTLTVELSSGAFKEAAPGNDISKAIEGVNELSVYPNPVSDVLVINYPLENSGTGELQIFDVMGKQVFQTIMTSSSYQLPTTKFNNGIYLLKVIDGEEVITQKFTVSH